MTPQQQRKQKQKQALLDAISNNDAARVVEVSLVTISILNEEVAELRLLLGNYQNAGSNYTKARTIDEVASVTKSILE